MKDIKYVEFVLENHETMKYNAEDVVHMEINDLYVPKGILFILTKLMKIKVTKNVVCVLPAKLDKEDKAFGLEYFPSRSDFWRISFYNDITMINLYDERNHRETYFVDYNEGTHYRELGTYNINQDSFINKHGDLFIVINPYKKIKDLFPAKILNRNLSDLLNK